VRCGADVRRALQQLRRCIIRLALADERVQRNVSGKALELKTPLQGLRRLRTSSKKCRPIAKPRVSPGEIGAAIAQADRHL
jgi:hypothetical protein